MSVRSVIISFLTVVKSSCVYNEDAGNDDDDNDDELSALTTSFESGGMVRGRSGSVALGGACFRTAVSLGRTGGEGWRVEDVGIGFGGRGGSECSAESTSVGAENEGGGGGGGGEEGKELAGDGGIEGTSLIALPLGGGGGGGGEGVGGGGTSGGASIEVSGGLDEGEVNVPPRLLGKRGKLQEPPVEEEGVVGLPFVGDVGGVRHDASISFVEDDDDDDKEEEGEASVWLPPDTETGVTAFFA